MWFVYEGLSGVSRRELSLQGCATPFIALRTQMRNVYGICGHSPQKWRHAMIGLADR